MMTLVKLVSPSGERTAIVVESIKLWQVQPPGYMRETPERTLVWLSEQPHPFTIHGNHDEALSRAVESVRAEWNGGGASGRV